MKSLFIFFPTTVDLLTYLGSTIPGQIYVYQQKIGNINYIVINIRPNIARVLVKLSEFLRNPSLAYIDAINHLLRYLVNTRYLVIEYNSLDLYNIRTFLMVSDVSFANIVDRKSF